MASNSNIVEGPINPRKPSTVAEFFGKNWVNPEIEEYEYNVLELELEPETGKAGACEKNPGHENFIKVADFSKNHLPEKYRERDDIFDYVSYWIPFTVKIIIKHISEKRPNTIAHKHVYPFRGSSRARFIGTGVLDIMRSIPQDLPCPCHVCQEADEKEKKHRFWSFTMHTATHTIFDDSEAAATEFECFHESDEDKKDGKEVKKLYGIKISDTLYKGYRWHTDRCQILCVTHDQELADRINKLTWNSSMVKPLYGTDLGIMISHPHGLSKRVTIGKIQHLSVPIEDFPTKVQIKFGPAAEYRLPDSWDRGSNQEEGFELKPGTNELWSQMTFFLPDTEDYALQFDFLHMPWFTFPPETTFFLPNGNEFKFPPETEFSIDMITQPYVYATYDIPTCRGCSGALLLMDWGEPPVEGFRHFGASELKGINKTGKHLYVQ